MLIKNEKEKNRYMALDMIPDRFSFVATSQSKNWFTGLSK